MHSQKRVSGVNVKLEKVNALSPCRDIKLGNKIIQYLTTTPRARMGLDTVLTQRPRGERNNCFSKIPLVG